MKGKRNVRFGFKTAALHLLEKLESRELLSLTTGVAMSEVSATAEPPAMLANLAAAPVLNGEPSPTSTAVPQSEETTIRSPAGNFLLRPASGNIVISPLTLADPNVAGFVLRDNWSAVNPAPGVFDWTRLDAAVNKIVAGGKDFKLAILTGERAPQWLYQNGAQSMTFYEDGGFRPTGTYKMPVPWDGAMLGFYDELLAEISTHFGSNAHLVGVNLGGPTRFSLEMHLPIEVIDQPGFSTAAIRGAWNHVLTTYAGLFPNTAGIIALANPVNMTDGIASQVAADAVAILGSRATLQHNALSAKPDLVGYNIHQLVATYASLGARTGYEELSVSTNARFGGSFNMAWQALLHAGGKYLDLYQPDDTLARSFPLEASAEIDLDVPQVVARQVFYNNSGFDGNNSAASAEDDAAIAFDKVALLPGDSATFSNYTSYSRGLNGIMIDLVGLSAAPTIDDFRFRIGNDAAVDGWSAAPPPFAINVRSGAGIVGSDRVTVIWPDGAIINRWLQVTVLPTSTTNLSLSDVFYFGNAIGETGDSDYHARVNATDELIVRNNPRTFLNPATIDEVFDINRDTFVNASDQIITRSHTTMIQEALRLIAPAVGTATGASMSVALGVAPVVASTMSDLLEDANPIQIASVETRPSTRRLLAISEPPPLDSKWGGNAKPTAPTPHHDRVLPFAALVEKFRRFRQVRERV